MAEATMWITRCQAVVDDFRGAPPGREKEARQRAQASLAALAGVRRAVVRAERAIRVAIKPAKRRQRCK